LRRYRPPVAGFVAVGSCLAVVVLGVALGLAEHAALLFMVIMAVVAVAIVWQALVAITPAACTKPATGL
jgi:hypothetical protein